ncbi:MAG: hypothetical protein WCA53_11650 [Caballeronia sp.]|jgi:hypothetical protein
MRRFKPTRQLQRFASVKDRVADLFRPAAVMSRRSLFFKDETRISSLGLMSHRQKIIIELNQLFRCPLLSWLDLCVVAGHIAAFCCSQLFNREIQR